LAAAAASGQIRRSLKQLRKEHGKNCHNCKTRKIDFVTCLVRPTHRFCDGCLRKLFNVEFANAHAEWDGIVHPEGCAICRHMCPCVGCRKRAHPPASPARNSSDASRKAKRPRDDADATDQHAPQRASGSGHCAAGSGDNDDSPRTKKPRESEKAEKNEKREEKEKKKVKEEKKTSSSGSSKRRRTRSLIDGRESTQEKESEDRVRRSSLDMHEDEDSVEMMTDADASEHLAAIPPGKSTRSRSRRRESAAAAAVMSTPPPPLHSKSTRSSARRSRPAAKGFNVPEGAGPEAFLGLVSAGSALSQRPTRRTPIRAPSADD
jgi:flagellar biosynthesis GTPase FlhF